jgi:hypothetical protein
MPTEFDSRLVIEWPMEPGWAEELYEYLWRTKVQDWIMTKWQREITAREKEMTDMFDKDNNSHSTKRLTASSRVLEIIETKHPDVFEGAASARADVEVKKRSDAIALMIDIHDGLRRELNGLKADVPATFNEDGSENTSARWSKSQLEKKAKLIEKISKGNKAYTKALETKDFQDVYNWNNSNKSGKPESKSGGDNSEKDG